MYYLRKTGRKYKPSVLRGAPARGLCQAPEMAQKAREEAMTAKKKQKRLWVWVVLYRNYSPQDPWRLRYAGIEREVSMEYTTKQTFGPRNVRVKRVEVKP